MQSEPTNAELAARLFVAENKIIELERLAREQRGIDVALLTRVDSFIEENRVLGRDQTRGFDRVETAQRDTSTRLDNIEAAIGELVATAKDHKANIEALAIGQNKIIALLTGGTGKRND